jgi:hypothetical protein
MKKKLFSTYNLRTLGRKILFSIWNMTKYRPFNQAKETITIFRKIK